MTKKLAIFSALALAAGVLLTSQTAQAFWSPASDSSLPRQSIIQALSDRFKLDKAQIEEVFNQYQSGRRGPRGPINQEQLQARLDQAVKNGAITSNQKQAIIDHFNERQKQRQEHFQEMEKFMEENGLDHDKMHEIMMGGDARGFGPRMMMQDDH